MDSKLLLVIATLAFAATTMIFNKQDAVDMTNSWEKFKVKHGKFYATETEEAYRFAIYCSNLKMIKEHNESNQKHHY